MKATVRPAAAIERIDIRSMADAARAVATSRSKLTELGFATVTTFLTATAVSELATNIINHAGSGTLTLRALEQDHRTGFEVIAEDDGPGIDDWEQACSEGFSTVGSLGLGLAGVLRIMDEVEFDRNRTTGTRIRAVRWR